MEFDHRDGKEKRDAISTMVRSHTGDKVFMEELQKCDLVCANCHRLRTAKRRQSGWGKQILAPETTLN